MKDDFFDEPVLRIHDGIPVGLQRMRDALTELDDQVHNYGWAMVSNDLEVEYEGRDSFTYTIGMHRKGYPDRIVPGTCNCADTVVHELAGRQIRAGQFEEGQVTQVAGELVTLTDWPYPQYLRMLSEFYRGHALTPRLLMIRVM